MVRLGIAERTRTVSFLRRGKPHPLHVRMTGTAISPSEPTHVRTQSKWVVPPFSFR